MNKEFKEIRLKHGLLWFLYDLSWREKKERKKGCLCNLCTPSLATVYVESEQFL